MLMSPLTLAWPQIIELLGAIQGVFLAGVLATKRSNRTANRLLAATMLAFSIYLATTVYHAGGFEEVYPHFFGAGHPMPFLFGPLVYLYAISAADRSRRFTRRDALHFLPFVAVVAAGLPIYLMSGPDKIALYRRIVAGELPPLIAVEGQLKLVSGVIYATVTLVFLRRHRDRLKASYSSLERVNLRWLVWLGAGGAAIWMLAVGWRCWNVRHHARRPRRGLHLRSPWRSWCTASGTWGCVSRRSSGTRRPSIGCRPSFGYDGASAAGGEPRWPEARSRSRRTRRRATSDRA